MDSSLLLVVLEARANVESNSGLSSLNRVAEKVIASPSNEKFDSDPH
jgi:hypothetical protein